MSDDIVWEEQRINPLERFDFKIFAYSNKYNVNFFLNKHYDEILFGMVIPADQLNLKKYVNLLVYSFITENISKGSRILEIGNENNIILNHFQYQRGCFKMENPELLKINSSDINKDKTTVIKDLNGKELEGFPEDYFDFIFSKSGFDDINKDESSNNEIIKNINRMLKPGGYVFLNFTGDLSGHNVLNNSLFNFITYNFDFEKFEQISIPLSHDEIKNDAEVICFHKMGSSDPNEKLISYNKVWRKKPLKLGERTNTLPADSLKKSPAYIFHHLIKCGGTSLNLALLEWFKVEVDREETYGSMESYRKFKINPVHLYSDICLTSHYQYEGVFLHQRYPDLIERKDEFRLFIFIRDPLSFRVSHYYYTRNEEWNKNFTLAQVIMVSENWISTLIPCTEDNYKEVLDRYFFIGIVEKMQESFDILADLAKKKRIVLPRENSTQKDDQLKNLSPEIIAKFKKNNYLDYLIYEYCLEKFNKIVSNKTD